MLNNLKEIVKISKNEVDKIEKKLILKTREIKNKKAEIDSINLHISNLTLPNTGSFNEFANFKRMIEAYLVEIEEIQEDINRLNKELNIIKDNLRTLNIKYEKTLYIYNQEKQKKVKYQQYLESKNMDEISNILYAQKD